jgi:hypothetical protein
LTVALITGHRDTRCFRGNTHTHARYVNEAPQRCPGAGRLPTHCLICQSLERLAGHARYIAGISEIMHNGPQGVLRNSLALSVGTQAPANGNRLDLWDKRKAGKRRGY